MSVVVTTNDELKIAVNNSAEEIQLTGEMLERYKKYKLLKKYGLAGIVTTSTLVMMLKHGRSDSIQKFALSGFSASKDRSIDSALILAAIATLPVLCVLIPVFFALQKNYDEVEAGAGDVFFRCKNNSRA